MKLTKKEKRTIEEIGTKFDLKFMLLYGDLTEYNEFRAMAFKNYMDSKDLFRLEEKLVLKYQEHLEKLCLSIGR